MKSPIGLVQQESQSRRCIRKVVPYHQLEFKRKALIVSLQDKDETKIVVETLSFLTMDRKKALDEEKPRLGFSSSSC